MRGLDDALHQALQRELDRRLRSMLGLKLEGQGIAFDEVQLACLLEALRSGDESAVKSCFDGREPHQSVDLLIDDASFNEIETGMTDHMDSRILDLSDGLACDVLASLEARWADQRRWERRQRTSFEKRLHRHWGAGLEPLEMLLVVAREFGDELARDADDDRRHSAKFGILLRLQARACQIATEVLVLLNAGLADGAMARWRTLHEVATVSFVLSAGDEDLAERYAAHDAIESGRAMRDYLKYQDRLNVEPLQESDLSELTARRAELVERYGAGYANGYGWACKLVGKPRPTFADLERAAGIDHLRAYYRLASHNVHANPKGVFFKLGLLGESDVLLAGPSNAGLSDPGQSTAISLVQANVHFATLIPTLDNVVVAKTMQLLVDHICEGFASADEALAGSA